MHKKKKEKPANLAMKNVHILKLSLKKLCILLQILEKKHTCHNYALRKIVYSRNLYENTLFQKAAHKNCVFQKPVWKKKCIIQIKGVKISCLEVCHEKQV